MSSPLCVLCGRYPPTPEGERILPNWLLGHLFPPSQRPDYTLHFNGQQVYAQNHVLPIELPVCNAPNGECNGVLQRRFERPFVRNIVKDMFEEGRRLDRERCGLVGEWWLKTLLFSEHPASRWQGDRFKRSTWPGDSDAALWTWTVTGEPPPPDVSLWVSKRARNGQHPSDVGPPFEPGRIHLPNYMHAGERLVWSQSSQLGVAQLQFQLLLHRGWDPIHPFESSGRAVRLWPPGDEFALADLPQLTTSEVAAWGDVWDYPVRLLVAPGYDVRSRRFAFGPNWDASFDFEVDGVSGLAHG